MKYILLLVVLFCIGCSDYNSSNIDSELSKYYAEYRNKIRTENEELSKIRSDKQVFYSTLNTDQLSIVDEYISSMQSDNDVKKQITFNALCNSLSREQVDTLLNYLIAEEKCKQSLQAKTEIANIIAERIEGRRIRAGQQQIWQQQKADSYRYNNSQLLNNNYQSGNQYQQQNQSYIIPPQDNSTYWQEENARREYYDAIRPRSVVPNNLGTTD